MSTALSAREQPVDLVLASASPRRREILTQLRLRFTVQPSDVEEPPFAQGDPAQYALGLAISKAEHVCRLVGDRSAAVIGADTVVVKGDAVLGKPQSDAEAVSMLTALQGGDHEVITAVALRGAGGLCHDVVVSTRVVPCAQSRVY